MTDAVSGAVVWQAEYEPFGEANVTTAVVTNNLRLPGQYYDGESGLHYNYFRDYDPALGRYLESDPIGLGGGINTYGYVGANPLKYIDPRGLVEQTDHLWQDPTSNCSYVIDCVNDTDLNFPDIPALPDWVEGASEELIKQYICAQAHTCDCNPNSSSCRESDPPKPPKPDPNPCKE
jgi:RHS repeat-associated protein